MRHEEQPTKVDDQHEQPPRSDDSEGEPPSKVANTSDQV